MFKIDLSKTARKSLKKIDTNTVKRIVKALVTLSEDPTPIGSKKLKGQTDDLYRIRVGDYRIIYTIKNDVLLVLVLTIGYRKDIYNNL